MVAGRLKQNTEEKKEGGVEARRPLPERRAPLNAT